MDDYYPHNALAYMQQQLSSLQQIHGLKIAIGLEVEFYLQPYDTALDLNLLANKAGFELKKERGQGQYEFATAASYEVVSLPSKLSLMKRNLAAAADILGKRADFAAKPKLADYGSSLQINASFDQEVDYQLIASSLCHYLPETIMYFLPLKSDLKRLKHNFMAPTHLCYGQNNRTAMLRLVTSSGNKRLEHRLPSNNCHLPDAINAMLWSINKGLSLADKIPLYENVFGNSFDEQYGLEAINDIWHKALAKSVNETN